MALIRVTRSLEGRNEEIILNTRHIVTAYSDPNNAQRGTFVQLVTGQPVLVKLTFDELWTLIQRET